jgi:hypothetical protein
MFTLYEDSIGYGGDQDQDQDPAAAAAVGPSCLSMSGTDISAILLEHKRQLRSSLADLAEAYTVQHRWRCADGCERGHRLAPFATFNNSSMSDDGSWQKRALLVPATSVCVMNAFHSLGLAPVLIVQVLTSYTH